MNINKNKERKNRSLVVTFRIFQALSFGILALGLSLMAGDGSKALELPFSSFALTTTVFGAIGSIVTGSLSKSCENW